MRLRPYGLGMFHLVPLRAEGETSSGIVIEHDRRLPPVYGRVTAVHPSCRKVRVGDWVLYLPNRPTRAAWSGGVVYALDEAQVVGIIRLSGDVPYFGATSREAVA